MKHCRVEAEERQTDIETGGWIVRQTDGRMD